jgi:hypothetical protein
MAKWDENHYVIEEQRNIMENEQSMAEAEEIFNFYAEDLKNLNPVIFEWVKRGYKEDMFWSQQSIDNSYEYLNETRRAYENRVKGAKKAAETRKINKLKVA